jgi:hypothetical protein
MTTATAIVKLDHKITKSDLQSLRTSESIVFHFHRNTGKTYINCIKRRDNITDDVHVDCNTRISAYGLNSRAVAIGEVVKAACVISFATSWDVEWRTIAEMLREGDILEAHWISCNNSDNLTAVGLFRDELKLHVRREDKRSSNGYRTLVFHVDSNICANNSAKMVIHEQTPRPSWDN